MKRLVALVLKYVIVAAIFEAYLLLGTKLNFGQILLISAVVTLVAYVGDLFILPHINNTMATLLDVVLAFLVVFLFRYIRGYESISIIDAIASVVLFGVSEWFFHKYMVSKVLRNNKSPAEH